MVGTVSPRVVKEVAGVMDLVVGQVFKGRCAIDDAGGDAVIGVGVGQGLGALKALLSDIG